MRVNKSSSKKVSTRRAHRADQAVYRTMRRRVTVLGGGKLFWIEMTLFVLILATLAISVKYFLF